MANRRILIIDDEKDVRELIKDMLKPKGFSTLDADSGRVGLEKAISEKPDLILLDIMLPDLNGFEVLKKLRMHPKIQSTPVIIVSGKSDTSSLFEIINSRMTDYIIKPFTSQILIKTITRCLGVVRFEPKQIDVELVTKIHDKLQLPKLILDKMSQGENVTFDFINKAIKNLDETIDLLTTYM